MNKSGTTIGQIRERGFTLVEALIVIGLTTLIAVGVVAGLLEGMDTIHQLTDSQTVAFGHQRVMQEFTKDVQAATWFYNGTTHDTSGTVILYEIANPYEIILGYPGPDGEEVWVRYRVRYGSFTGESYLVRTMATSSGQTGMTILTTGVANLGFTYFNKEGVITDKLSDVKKIQMTLSLNVGGATEQRLYDVTMRNVNEGVKVAPYDFDEIENEEIEKSDKGKPYIRYREKKPEDDTGTEE